MQVVLHSRNLFKQRCEKCQKMNLTSYSCRRRRSAEAVKWGTSGSAHSVSSDAAPCREEVHSIVELRIRRLAASGETPPGTRHMLDKPFHKLCTLTEMQKAYMLWHVFNARTQTNRKAGHLQLKSSSYGNGNGFGGGIFPDNVLLPVRIVVSV